MQKIIDIDSQILSSIQNCARKTELHFIKHIEPEIKAEALEKGELIHIPLEIYYSLLCDGPINHLSKTWLEISNNLFSGINRNEFFDKLQEIKVKGKPAIID